MRGKVVLNYLSYRVRPTDYSFLLYSFIEKRGNNMLTGNSPLVRLRSAPPDPLSHSLHIAPIETALQY